MRISQMESNGIRTTWIPYTFKDLVGLTVYFPRILVTGPFNAGKSTVVKAVSEKSISIDRMGTTVAFDYGNVNITGIEAEIFGTPGQERFEFIFKIFAREVSGVLLVVDASHPDEFSRARQMLDLVGPRIPYVILANKSDLPGAIPPDEIAHRMSLPEDVPVIPTVATENKGVRDALLILAEMIIGVRQDARRRGETPPGNPHRAAEVARRPRGDDRPPGWDPNRSCPPEDDGPEEDRRDGRRDRRHVGDGRRRDGPRDVQLIHRGHAYRQDDRNRCGRRGDPRHDGPERGEHGSPPPQRRPGGPVDFGRAQSGGGARVTDVWVRLEETIDELSRVSDIKSAAVVRRDGLVVTHTLPDGVDPKMVAAMTAAIVGTSEMATIQLAQGRFVRAIIESDEGKLLSLGAGEEALLVALVYDDANLGLVLLAMERAAKQVEKILRDSAG